MSGGFIGSRYVLKLLFGEKKHKIANNLTTNAAKKNRLGILRTFYVCLNKVKNKQSFFNKISHQFLVTAND